MPRRSGVWCLRRVLVVPTCATYLHGHRALFLLTAGLTATGTLVFWICFRTPRGEYARRD